MMSSEPPQRFSFMYQTFLLPSAQLILTPAVVGIPKVPSSGKSSMLLSWDYCNKYHTFDGLKGHLYSFTILEARSLKLMSLSLSRCQQDHSFSQGFRGESVPCLFQLWWLPSFLGFWPHHPSLEGQHLQISLAPLYIALSSVCLHVSLPLPFSCMGTCDYI